MYIERGVRQGNTISPEIFTAAIEEVFKKLVLEERDFNIDREMLTNLRFADEILALMTASDKENQLNKVNSESKKRA